MDQSASMPVAAAAAKMEPAVMKQEKKVLIWK